MKPFPKLIYGSQGDETIRYIIAFKDEDQGICMWPSYDNMPLRFLNTIHSKTPDHALKHYASYDDLSNFKDKSAKRKPVMIKADFEEKTFEVVPLEDLGKNLYKIFLYKSLIAKELETNLKDSMMIRTRNKGRINDFVNYLINQDKLTNMIGVGLVTGEFLDNELDQFDISYSDVRHSLDNKFRDELFAITSNKALMKLKLSFHPKELNIVDLKKTGFLSNIQERMDEYGRHFNY